MFSLRRSLRRRCRCGEWENIIPVHGIYVVCVKEKSIQIVVLHDLQHVWTKFPWTQAKISSSRSMLGEHAVEIYGAWEIRNTLCSRC